MTSDQKAPNINELAAKVRQAFMIFPEELFLEKLEPYSHGDHPCAKAVASAIDGLRSTISAASLPFQLIQNSVFQRRFDRFHASEAIIAHIPRELKGASHEELSEEAEQQVRKCADEKMAEFLSSEEGKDFMRDQIIFAMISHLRSQDVRAAAEQLRIQTLISTWSIFESFSRSFVTSWINENPSRASLVLSSADLKEFFGKQAIDIKTIGDHNFDLSSSMGNIIFSGRRLDSLSVIRSTMKALFNSANIQNSLGKDLWLLNQRRHIFVHNRGVIDQDYLQKTGESASIGDRLEIRCDDVEHYLLAVRTAIIAISEAVAESLCVQEPTSTD